MTSPYTPEFEHTDWPNGPLQAHLPSTNSPNAVLNRVEAEFDNVAAAFAELGSLRAVVNALLAGRAPTTLDLPVSPGAGEDLLNRAVLLDGVGGLVVVWASPRAGDVSHVYAARLDLAVPELGFAAPVAVTSGGTAAADPTAVALPSGELVVAYRTGGGVVMKRAPLAGLSAATAQSVAPSTHDSPHAVLAGGRIVFFTRGSGADQLWYHRRYDHTAGTFVDTAPVRIHSGPTPTSHRGLHAAASGSAVWMAYGFHDGDEFQYLRARRLNVATGTLTDPVDLNGRESQPYVLPTSDTEAIVFHNDGNGLRATTTGAQSLAVPGSLATDDDPAAVRDTDGTLHLFYTRPYGQSARAIMLSRRTVTGDWSPPQRVSQLPAHERTPQPVVAAGRDLWLAYTTNRTGDTDVHATRIITAI